MLRSIDRVILKVPSVASSTPFYRDVLKLQPLRIEAHVATFKLPEGGELVIHDDADQPFEQVYFLVDDVRDLYRRRDELKLQFVQSPRPTARGFKATVKDPFGTVLLLLDQTAESAARVEDAASSQGLFPGAEPDVAIDGEDLSRLYESVGCTADDLPYTPQFEKLYDQYAARHAEARPTHRQLWRHILTLRKGGNLPRLGQAVTPPPAASPEAIALLKNLLGPHHGKRDRLPYTEEFQKLVDEFNASQDRPLSPHLVWRLVARLAK